jgi:(2Fe-2S) ferredoxin
MQQSEVGRTRAGSPHRAGASLLVIHGQFEVLWARFDHERQLKSDGPMEMEMGPFAIHIFVCTTGGTCPHQRSVAIHSYLKEAVAQAGLKGRVRVNHSGCLDQCGHGPNLVIYPEGVWYSHVTREEAETIFNEHILGGRPVERLRFRSPNPGGHKLARSKDGKPTERCSLCRGGNATTYAYVGGGNAGREE